MHMVSQPVLADFSALNPGITINLVTRASCFVFRAVRRDSTMHSGQPNWRSAAMSRNDLCLKLLSEHILRH